MQFQICFSASDVMLNNSPDAIVSLSGISFTALFYAAGMIMLHWKYQEVWNRKESYNQFYLYVEDSSCGVIG